LKSFLYQKRSKQREQKINNPLDHPARAQGGAKLFLRGYYAICAQLGVSAVGNCRLAAGIFYLLMIWNQFKGIA
jgi:hypothetical protein